MARVTGLIFILPVRDLDRAARFYADAFGMDIVFRNERLIFVGNPGDDSSIGLRLDDAPAGAAPENVGLHLDHASDVDRAIADIEAAGGRIIERGERAGGAPFARFADPDGNVLRI